MSDRPLTAEDRVAELIDSWSIDVAEYLPSQEQSRALARDILATLDAARATPVDGLREALEAMATRWEGEAAVRVSDPKASAASLLAAGVQRSHAQSIRAVLYDAALAADNPTRDAGIDVERLPAKYPLSRMTLTELRDKAEAAGITYWDDTWTRRDFLDALSARVTPPSEPS